MTEENCRVVTDFLTYISLSLDSKIVRTVMKIKESFYKYFVALPVLSLLIIAMHISYISHFGSDNFFRMVLVYLWEMRNCFQISPVIPIELLSKIATVTAVRCRSKSLKCFCREREL